MQTRHSKTILIRFTGALLILTALVGWLLSLSSLAWLWNTRPHLTQSAQEWVELSSRTLDTTEGMLQVIEDTLVQAEDTLERLKSTLESTGTSLRSTVTVVGQVGGLVGVDMVKVVDDTQASLVAASASAKLVDDTLRVVAAIPFIGQQYQPKVTLSESITDIAFSLETMNTSLLQIQTGVEDTARKLDEVRWLLEDLSRQVIKIQPGIADARKRVDEYQVIVSDLQQKNIAFEQALPGLMSTLYTLLTIVLLWIVFSQLGTFLQGLQLFAPHLLLHPGNSHETPVA